MLGNIWNMLGKPDENVLQNEYRERIFCMYLSKHVL